MKLAANLALGACLLIPAGLLAQKRPVQQVIPPTSVYWLSAATTSGFVMGAGAAPSAGDMMRMAMGGGGGSARSLQLDLGSKQAASGPPQAVHAIPPSMAMGPQLLLKTPAKPRTTITEDTEDFERPKGRTLLFWGCGESARPGQPVVIDFSNMAAGQVPPGLFGGERVRIARPPAPGRWTTYGGWPNDDGPSRRGVPANASLIGAHKVSGNYSPEINFTLAQDFMAPLVLTQAKTASAAVSLNWNQIPANTGHFAQMFGGSERGGEPTVVFWSSSETQTFISALGDYVAPAEAARLVGKKQLMPPTQTSCAIPKEAVAAAEGGMITLVAHGPEQNVIHPPRPTNPAVPWKQDYAVKARFVSRAGAVIGMEDMGGGMDDEQPSSRRSSRRNRDRASEANCTPRDALGGVGRALGGLLGGGRMPPPCPE
jgi:hypothetical protein